jgi:hypothetical protein
MKEATQAAAEKGSIETARIQYGIGPELGKNTQKLHSAEDNLIILIQSNKDFRHRNYKFRSVRYERYDRSDHPSLKVLREVS